MLCIEVFTIIWALYQEVHFLIKERYDQNKDNLVLFFFNLVMGILYMIYAISWVFNTQMIIMYAGLILLSLSLIGLFVQKVSIWKKIDAFISSICLLTVLIVLAGRII